IPVIEGLVGPGSTDAELAVALWLFNCALGRELLTGPEPERVMALDGEAVAADPLNAVSAAAAFLGLALPDVDALRALLSAETMRDAKNISRAFGAEARRLDLETAALEFGDEAEQGVSWALRSAPELVAASPFALR